MTLRRTGTEPGTVIVRDGGEMTVDRSDYRRVYLDDLLTWTLLFRGFRLAREPKKILLGMAGALLMSLGWNAIASFTTRERPTPPEPDASAETLRDYGSELRRQAVLETAAQPLWQGRTPKDSQTWRLMESPPNIYVSPFRDAGWTSIGIDIPSSAFLVLEPLYALVFPARAMLTKPSLVGIGALLLIWTLLVWSLFGAAICRIASVQVARNGNVGLFESIRFVLARYLTFLTAPVLPFFGIFLIALACLIGGWLLWVPGLDIVAAAVWFLPLAAALVAVSALLGIVLGWPLMYAAIAAEATESFDALSRSFSYVLGRPWNYLFYAVIGVLYGAVCMMFVTAVADGIIYLSHYAISYSYFDVVSLYAYAPTAPGWTSASEINLPAGGTKYISSLFIGFWTHVAFLALVGFVYSFFWSEVTVIYFLLRHDVDETDIEEVYLEEEEEEPFPTATPTVPGPRVAVAPPSTTAGDRGPSLPIIDPPK